jgi:hypothetical protein
LGETLAWFAEATRSTAAPHEREATWCRVEAQIAGSQLPAGGREGATHKAQRRTAALGSWLLALGSDKGFSRLRPHQEPRAKSQEPPYRLAVAVTCGFVVLAWSCHFLPHAPRRPDAAGTPFSAPREVRLNPALWQRDALAEEPAGDAIDELARVLKP